MPTKGFRQYTEQQLIQTLRDFETQHSKRPSWTQAMAKLPPLLHPEAYQRYFGSWSAAMTAAGFKEMPGAPVVDLRCLECGTTFQRTQSREAARQKQKRGGPFCSSACSGKYICSHKAGDFRVSRMEKIIRSLLASRFPNLETAYGDRSVIRLELDFYFPSIRVAIEINGPFHYRPIFGAAGLRRTQRNDALKEARCQELGVRLTTVQHLDNQPTLTAVNRVWSEICAAIGEPLVPISKPEHAEMMMALFGEYPSGGKRRASMDALNASVGALAHFR